MNGNKNNQIVQVGQDKQAFQNNQDLQAGDEDTGQNDEAGGETRR
jgi:hypothetical protein